MFLPSLSPPSVIGPLVCCLPGAQLLTYCTITGSTSGRCWQHHYRHTHCLLSRVFTTNGTYLLVPVCPCTRLSFSGQISLGGGVAGLDGSCFIALGIACFDCACVCLLLFCALSVYLHLVSDHCRRHFALQPLNSISIRFASLLLVSCCD